MVGKEVKTLQAHIKQVCRDYESADRVERELRIKKEVDKYFQTSGWFDLLDKYKRKEAKENEERHDA